VRCGGRAVRRELEAHHDGLSSETDIVSRIDHVHFVPAQEVAAAQR